MSNTPKLADDQDCELRSFYGTRGMLAANLLANDFGYKKSLSPAGNRLIVWVPRGDADTFDALVHDLTQNPRSR